MRPFLALAALTLSACATPPADDLGALQADLDAKRSAASATFAAPPDRVFGAVRSILDAISDDYEYSLDDAGRLLVSRRVHYVGGVLTTISGRDYWVFEVRPDGEATALTVRGVAVDNTGF
ncbi:MAG TPA: hypothetical protein PLS69_12230, partial [Terricaulis sp.]|nr:hypothetical protein [Terricaulis sp.]